MGIWLVMKTAAGDERPFPVRKPRTVIGREPNSDVRIPIPSVAMRHCEITWSDEELRLTDLGSVRGTLHNGKRITEATLQDEDRLTVGPVTFQVRMGQDPSGQHAVTEVKPAAAHDPASTPPR